MRLTSLAAREGSVAPTFFGERTRAVPPLEARGRLNSVDKVTGWIISFASRPASTSDNVACEVLSGTRTAAPCEPDRWPA